ncbi:hypothetical protein RvY_17780 [Ramazzottius varieornatus]|uniref:Syndecan/Neurexin domain-containing protein n=1 Tax=Ramazzottius varieornatus TaxID=947166 RepID=A0A1D1W3D2_RAMVA|nr:hypothetical protein RvY_17780 [Ramazzottius varieornatus]
MKAQLVFLGLVLCLSSGNAAPVVPSLPDGPTFGGATSDAGTSADPVANLVVTEEAASAEPIDLPNAPTIDQSASTVPSQLGGGISKVAAFDAGLMETSPKDRGDKRFFSSTAEPPKPKPNPPPMTRKTTISTTTKRTSTATIFPATTTPEPDTTTLTTPEIITSASENTLISTTPPTREPVTEGAVVEQEVQSSATVEPSDGLVSAQTDVPAADRQLVPDAAKSSKKTPTQERAAVLLPNATAKDATVADTADSSPPPTSSSPVAKAANSTYSTSTSPTESGETNSPTEPPAVETAADNTETATGESRATSSSAFPSTDNTAPDVTESHTPQSPLLAKQEPLLPVVVWSEAPPTTTEETTTTIQARATTSANTSETFNSRTEQQKKEDQDELRLKIALGVVIPVFALLFIAGIIAFMKHRNEKGVTVLVEHEEGTITYPKPAVMIR